MPLSAALPEGAINGPRAATDEQTVAMGRFIPSGQSVPPRVLSVPSLRRRVVVQAFPRLLSVPSLRDGYGAQSDNEHVGGVRGASTRPEASR